ncbi:MAG: PAS domain-containing protein [Leptospiraceae bacterium]|nr:PAS domain-containing protein [Leptospiraceae bacterium]
MEKLNPKYLNEILDNMEDVVYSTSYPEFHLIFITPSIERLTGYDIQNFQNDPMFWTKIYHPDDLSNIQEAGKALAETGKFTDVYRIYTQSGELRWFKNRGKIIYSEDGQPLRVDGIINDITEIKVAELEVTKQQEMNLDLIKENQIIFNGSQDAIFLIEVFEEGRKGFKVRRLNRAYEVLTGITQDWIAGKTIPEIVGPELAVKIEENYHRMISERKSISYEESFPLPAGTRIWLTVLNPIFNEANQIIFIVGSSTDITQKKLIETQLIEAKKEAEEASTAKGQFLANMSHEIRTPLNGILGFTELLTHSNLEKQEKEYLHNIHFSALTLLELVNQILDISKVESGKLELELIGVPLVKLCRYTLDAYDFIKKSEDIKLKLDYDSRIPPFLKLDPLRLRQIFNNLLSNSLKFTSQGSVLLKVSYAGKTDRGLHLIDFSVSDTGIGISSENKKLIFESFSQADNSITRKYGGTGLGLTITKMLVHLMNSEIHLESKEGVGSTFSFRLELDEAENDESNLFLKPTIRKEVTKASTPLMGKILLVDDNSVNRALVKAIIRKNFPGVQLIEAINGEEAIRSHFSQNSDLILMDVQMPILDGYSATREIRKQESSIETAGVPIIALTAGAIEGDKEKCLEAGMNDYLSKPIDPKLLIEKINNFIS